MSTDRIRSDCARARDALDLQFDADLMDAAMRQQLEDHLVGCSECRETKAELEELQERLRGLRGQTMPDAALEAVLDRTVRSSPLRKPRRLHWRIAAGAAAAALVIAIFGLWPAADLEPTAAEIAAARDAMHVLKLTSQALRRSEQAAFHGVLGDEVSGTLRRVPIDWPESASEAGTDRSEES